jgi:hypothetical protein
MGLYLYVLKVLEKVFEKSLGFFGDKILFDIRVVDDGLDVIAILEHAALGETGYDSLLRTGINAAHAKDTIIPK